MASGSNFPTVLDAFTDHQTGDFATIREYNQRNSALEKLEQTLVGFAGVDLLANKNANSDPNLAFTSSDFVGGVSAYDHYIIAFTDVIPETDNVTFWAQVSQSGTWQNDAATYSYAEIHNFSTSSTPSGSTNAFASLALALNVGNGSGDSLSGEVNFFKPSGTAAKKKFLWTLSYSNGGGIIINWEGTGIFTGNNNAIDGIRFLMEAGDFSGNFKLYGMRKN